MAVTILTRPNDWSASDNPLNYTFSSNQTTQPNFSFIVYTKLNGTTISVDRVFPEVSTQGHWDASPSVSTRIAKPTFGSNVLLREAGYSGTVSITVQEEYGTTPTPQAQATSSDIRAFKCALSNQDWLETDFTTWVQSKFLTNMPDKVQDVTPDQLVTANIITDGTFNYSILFYDENDVVIRDISSSSVNRFIAQFKMNRDILISEGAFNYDDASYYTLQVDSSEIIRYNIKRDFCHPVNYVHWLNQYGAYDSFIFDHSNTFSNKVSKFSYEKHFGKWVNITYTYDALDSGEFDYLKRISKSGQAVTNWLQISYYNWLNETIDSVYVFITGDYITITKIQPSANNYSVLDWRFDDIDSYVLNYDIAHTQNSLLL